MTFENHQFASKSTLQPAIIIHIMTDLWELWRGNHYSRVHRRRRFEKMRSCTFGENPWFSYFWENQMDDIDALECFSEAESAPIRSACKFCVDLYVRNFSQLFQKIFFRSTKTIFSRKIWKNQKKIKIFGKKLSYL